MSPRTQKTSKKTPARRSKGPSAAQDADLNPINVTLPNPLIADDVEALKTSVEQLAQGLDDLQTTLPEQVAEARALAIGGNEKLAERFDQLLDEAKSEFRSNAKQGTDAHNLSVGRIDRLANHADDSHRSLLEENQRLAKRISGIDIDLDKHRRFHDSYGAEAINEASQTQADKIARLTTALVVGLAGSVGIAGLALFRTLG